MKKDLLERYCAACKAAYIQIRSGETFDLVTGQKANFVAYPFLEEQLSIILGMPERDVAENLKSQILTIRKTGAHKVLGLKDCIESGSEPLPQKITNEDLIKLAIFYNVLGQVSDTESAISPEQAVFPVKNGLDIPDDFMPSGIMDLVEGRPLQNFQSVMSDLNPSFGSEIVFPVFKFGDSGPVGLDAIVPVLDPFANASNLNYEEISTTLSTALNQFKNSDSFQAFSLGRIFRSVRFTIEKRKTRELKKPLFNDEKISMLKSAGILDLSGTTPKVRDDLSYEEIIRMAEKYESMNHKIAMSWKSRISELPISD